MSLIRSGSLAAVLLFASAAQAQTAGSAPAPDAGAAAGPAPAATVAVEQFVREQMAACNADRQQHGEPPRFAADATVRVIRALRRGFYRVAIDQGEVAVNPRTQRIQSTRGPRHPLPNGMDFCPSPIWVGPMHD